MNDDDRKQDWERRVEALRETQIAGRDTPINPVAIYRRWNGDWERRRKQIGSSNDDS